MKPSQRKTPTLRTKTTTTRTPSEFTWVVPNRAPTPLNIEGSGVQWTKVESKAGRKKFIVQKKSPLPSLLKNNHHQQQQQPETPPPPRRSILRPGGQVRKTTVDRIRQLVLAEDRDDQVLHDVPSMDVSEDPNPMRPIAFVDREEFSEHGTREGSVIDEDKNDNMKKNGNSNSNNNDKPNEFSGYETTLLTHMARNKIPSIAPPTNNNKGPMDPNTSYCSSTGWADSEPVEHPLFFIHDKKVRMHEKSSPPTQTGSPPMRKKVTTTRTITPTRNPWKDIWSSLVGNSNSTNMVDEKQGCCEHCQKPFSFFEPQVTDFVYHSTCKVTGYFHPACRTERVFIKKRKEELLDRFLKFGVVLQRGITNKRVYSRSQIHTRVTHQRAPKYRSGVRNPSGAERKKSRSLSPPRNHTLGRLSSRNKKDSMESDRRPNSVAAALVRGQSDAIPILRQHPERRGPYNSTRPNPAAQPRPSSKTVTWNHHVEQHSSERTQHTQKRTVMRGHDLVEREGPCTVEEEGFDATTVETCNRSHVRIIGAIDEDAEVARDHETVGKANKNVAFRRFPDKRWEEDHRRDKSTVKVKRVGTGLRRSRLYI